MGDMTDAFVRQLAEYNKSQYIDRTAWTRQQWIDDADKLMSSPDGAITSLKNGHATALLSGIEALQSKLDATETQRDQALEALTAMYQPINIIFDGPPGAVSGRFIEVEDDQGHGLGVGEWIELPGRQWALRITELPRKEHL